MKRVKFLALALTCLVMSSCSSTSGISKTYYVQGLSDHADTQKYVENLIKERTDAVEIEDEEDEAAILSYHQENLRRDIAQAMQAKGYYAADVSYVDGEDGVYSISAGKQATLSSVFVSPKTYLPYMQDVDLHKGDALDAGKILLAQNDLHKAIQKESCAYGLKVSHKAKLDTQTMGADLTFVVDQGQPATLGAITYYGAEDTKRSYIDKIVKWKEGECFRRSTIDKAKDKLLATGLFSRVDIKLPENLKKGGVVPVTFELKERAQRTVKAGLSYYTDEGVKVSAGWEHRNFFGSGEKVNVDANVSKLEQSLDAKFTKPYFMRDDQSLTLKAFIDREDNDAYEELASGVGFGVTRQLNKRLSATLGSDFEITEITEENEESETFGLIKPNASLTYDSRDNSLDPHKGVLLSGGVVPYIDAFGETSPFFKTRGSAQGYYSPINNFVLAGRMKIGSIVGTNTEDIPASERFYAGGGGSVRGFGYQEVGPEDDDGDPAGGRSLFEASTELRYKFTDTLGAVAFVDAGHVGEKVIPVMDDLSLGAGVGARYYTDFGPLRLDVGVPITGKDNTDQNYQIYISIGQAF